MLDVKLTTPKGLGGDGAPGTNPEQLFAAGYSACFIGAMKHVARQAEDRAAGRHVDHRRRRHRPDPAGLRHPGRAERQRPRHGQGAAQKLVEAAHQVCPYSNATRGNIEVALERRLTRGAAALRPRGAREQAQHQLDARLAPA